MILEQIIAYKKREVALLKEQAPVSAWEESCYTAKKRSMKQALGKSGVGLIAEIKKASPSKGVLRENLDCLQTAACYEANGAAAISVLTDEHFFQGSLEDLQLVKEAVKLPVLRKDFIIDPYQIYEAKAHGADAILLITAVLTQQELFAFLEIARRLELEALTEVHNREEIARASVAGAEIMGINNRDLQTFQVDLQTTLELAGLVPKGCRVVSESGIFTARDVSLLAEVGVDGILVGEALITSLKMEEKVRELSGR